LLLTACNKGPEPAEEIYNHLEKAVLLEEVFEEQQAPLVELETKEQKLYDEIISLGMAEFDRIKTLSNEAISIIDERKNRIEKEYESLKASKQEVEFILPIIDGMEETELKQQAQSLYDQFIKRFESYEELYQAYSTALSYDRTLYEILQTEELTLEQLENQITKINESYETVVTENDAFNKLTEQYNEEKKTFYSESGLNVSFGEEDENKQE
jgi:hypothetical protein